MLRATLPAATGTKKQRQKTRDRSGALRIMRYFVANQTARGFAMRHSSILLALVVTLGSAGSAFAVSDYVKQMCRDDYFEHCSMHEVGSPGLRKCMRAVGPRLSKGCIHALKVSGEINKKDSSRVAKREKKMKKRRG
jgi:hypothetical protein